MVQQSKYQKYFKPGLLKTPVSFYELAGTTNELGEITDDMVLVKNTFALVLEKNQSKDQQSTGSNLNIQEYILVLRNNLDVNENQKVEVSGTSGTSEMFNIKTIIRTRDNWMVVEITTKIEV